MEKLLVEFILEKKQYRVWGSYSMNEDNCPEFEDLRAEILADGKYAGYTPDGHTWAGRKFEVEDMISDCLANLIRCCGIYTILYMDEGLADFASAYHEDIVLTVNNLKIPRRIMSTQLMHVFELVLITSQFIYYVHDDQMIMLDTDTHGLVSDNYFAEVGYTDSLENIENGKEKLIWRDESFY